MRAVAKAMLERLQNQIALDFGHGAANQIARDLLGAELRTAASLGVPVAILTELVSGDVYQWGALMAGSLLGSLPVAIFYSLFVDYYVSSLTGAVKE